VVLATLVLAGCASSHAATTSAKRVEVVQLRALERPLLRSVKQTFIAVAANRQRQAKAKLEASATGAKRLLRRLDSHERFVRANRDALSCLHDPLHELGEQADLLGPLLKRSAATRAQRTRLEHTLGEAANCIEASG
jgi:outer membrane murein-binding lipoprotein Lpp